MAQGRTIDFDETVVLDERRGVADGAAPSEKTTQGQQRGGSARSANGKRMARAKIIAPIVVLVLAAAEAVIGLALALALFRRKLVPDVDDAAQVRG